MERFSQASPCPYIQILSQLSDVSFDHSANMPSSRCKTNGFAMVHKDIGELELLASNPEANPTVRHRTQDVRELTFRKTPDDPCDEICVGETGRE